MPPFDISNIQLAAEGDISTFDKNIQGIPGLEETLNDFFGSAFALAGCKRVQTKRGPGPNAAAQAMLQGELDHSVGVGHDTDLNQSVWVAGTLSQDLRQWSLRAGDFMALEFRPDPYAPSAGNFIAYFKLNVGWPRVGQNAIVVPDDGKSYLAYNNATTPIPVFKNFPVPLAGSRSVPLAGQPQAPVPVLGPMPQGTWAVLASDAGLTIDPDDIPEDWHELQAFKALLNGAQRKLAPGLNCFASRETANEFLSFDTSLIVAEPSDKGQAQTAQYIISPDRVELRLDQPNTSFPDVLKGHFDLQHLELGFWTSTAAQDMLPVYGGTFQANVTLFGTPVVVYGDIPFKGTDYLEMRVSFLKPLNLVNGLKDLASLLGKEQKEQIDLPDAFPSKLKLGIEQLTFGVNSSGLTAFEARIGLQAGQDDKGWEVLPDIFTFYQIGLDIAWTKGQSPDITIRGAMNFLTYDFFLVYRHPGDIFRADIAPGAETNSKLVGLLHDEMGLDQSISEGLGDLATAFDLSLYYNRDAPEFEITISTQDPWNIAKIFEIERVTLRISYYGDENNQLALDEIELSAMLKLPIGPSINGERQDVHLFLDGLYEKPEKRWSFDAETGPGEPIALGDAIDALANHIGGGDQDLPEAIKSLTLQNVIVRFDNKGFIEFACEADIKIGDDGDDLGLRVYLRKESGNIVVAASLLLAYGYEFDLVWGKSSTNQNVLANFTGPVTVQAKDLLRRISPEIADAPIDLEFTLQGILLAFHKDQPKADQSPQDKPKSEFLFRILLAVSVDFTHFPLIGDLFPAGSGINGIQLVAANKPFAHQDLTSLNTLIGEVPARSPIPPISTAPHAKADEPPIEKGLSLSADISLGDAKHSLFVNFGGSKSAQQGKTTGLLVDGKSSEQAVAATATANSASRTQVAKSFGAVHIETLSLDFKNGNLGLIVSGSLQIGPLSLTLIDLKIASPIKSFSPSFGLSGLGLDFNRDPLEIGAAFLRKTYNVGQPDEYDEYVGMVQLRFKQLQLSGLGAYAKFQGHPSLFLYAYLGYPFGGPPAFFVTGLAAGFGVNRDFIPPPIDKIQDFPLIKVAAPAQKASTTPPTQAPEGGMVGLQKMIDDLHTYLPPRVGKYFVVAGVHFTSFGLIDTIVLAAVIFGQELEIDLLGVSSISTPRSFVELNFLVRFVPGEGYLLARGELSGRSYLLAPLAHLTGGFAAAFWFTGSHAGDFVVSVGGYHPLYAVPNHYPGNIPRLGINWQISDKVSLKGGIYFAICPQALMLGGFMDASYSSGALSAWFKLNIDFIIYWEPFHYDATAMIEVGVRATIDLELFDQDIDVHICAGVHVWGPEFSGKASLDVGVKTFEVTFGANAPHLPAPIAWDTFKEKFLPEEPCTLNIAGGLIKKAKWKLTEDGAEKEKELWIVNAKQLRMQVDSLIPVTKSGNATLTKVTSTGIAPMDLSAYTSTLTVTLTTESGGSMDAHVKYTPVSKNVPSALWGHSLKDLALNPKDGGLIEDVFGGLEITPANDPEGGLTHEMDRNMLAFNLDEQDLDYDFLDGLAWQAVKPDFEPHGYRTGSQTRQAILRAFRNVTGICEEDLDIGDYGPEQFDYLTMPQVIALKGVEQ